MATRGGPRYRILGRATGPDRLYFAVWDKAEATARANLNAAGFTTINSQPEASNDAPAGTVIRVDPAPGTEVPPDQAITLVVSAGREKVSVPRVEGLSEDNARRLIESAGLSVEVSDQEVQNQDQDGTVLTQSPAPNAQVELGSTVNIVVGRYFPPLPGEGGGGG